MQNFHFLLFLFDQKSPHFFLSFIGCLSIIGLLDIFLILRLSLLIGPWAIMSLLALGSSVGLFIAEKNLKKRLEALEEMIDKGVFPGDYFVLFLGTLLASLSLVIPGFLKLILAMLFLLPPVSTKLGRLISRMAGIPWQETYEYLRVSRLSR